MISRATYLYCTMILNVNHFAPMQFRFWLNIKLNHPVVRIVFADNEEWLCLTTSICFGPRFLCRLPIRFHSQRRSLFGGGKNSRTRNRFGLVLRSSQPIQLSFLQWLAYNFHYLRINNNVLTAADNDDDTHPMRWMVGIAKRKIAHETQRFDCDVNTTCSALFWFCTLKMFHLRRRHRRTRTCSCPSKNGKHSFRLLCNQNGFSACMHFVNRENREHYPLCVIPTYSHSTKMNKHSYVCLSLWNSFVSCTSQSERIHLR